MENQVQLFESEEFGRIRVVEIDGQPWFVAKDVCDVFGETNRNRAMQSLDDDEKGYTQTNTPGGQQQIAIVNESGLYSLLFVMKPSKARGVSKDYIIERETKLKDFRRWVTHKVLPSIRQHGTYITDAVLDEMTRSREFADNLLLRLQSAGVCRQRNRCGNEAGGQVGEGCAGSAPAPKIRSIRHGQGH